MEKRGFDVWRRPDDKGKGRGDHKAKGKGRGDEHFFKWLEADLSTALGGAPCGQRLGPSFFSGASKRALDVLKAAAATALCGEAARERLAALAAALAAASGDTITALEELARRCHGPFKAESAPEAQLALATEAAALELTRGEAQALLLLSLAAERPERSLRALLLECERRRQPMPSVAVALVLLLLQPALPPGWSRDGRLEEALRRGASAAELVEATRGVRADAKRSLDDGTEEATKELERLEALTTRARRAVSEAYAKRARLLEERAKAFEDVVRGEALEGFLEELFEGAAAAAEVAAELPKLRAFAERLDHDAADALPYVMSLRRRLLKFAEQTRALLEVKRSSLDSARSSMLVERATAEAVVCAVNELAVARGLPRLPDMKECPVERLAQVLRDAPALLQRALSEV